MIEHHTSITTADGEMNTFVTRPESDGPHPVVFFYMDAPGKREELHDMARRISSTGYYVVLPNLYYRKTPSYVLVREEPASRQYMQDLMASLSNDMIVADTQAMLDHVDADPSADAGRIGCVGYCMSGPFTIYIAGAYPERIACAASIYGVRLATDADDSPHKRAADIKGEIYVACAEHDEHVPAAMITTLETAFEDAGTNATVEWYPGTHHGFAFPQRPVYDQAAGERHWERLHALFARNLR